MPKKTPFSSFLTSPTIRLLPDPSFVPSPSSCDTQFIVHRSLLVRHSPNLKKRTRENYIIIDGADEQTVGRFLEWVYQGDYSLPEGHEDSDLEHDDAGQEEIQELHPIVAAAAMGAVGVWAKKAAIFGRRYAYDGDVGLGAAIRSKYIDVKTGKAIHSLYTTLEEKGKRSKTTSEVMQLATPPLSPLHERATLLFPLPLQPAILEAPRLDKVYPYPEKKLPKEVIYQQRLCSDLEQHLSIYLLSLRYLVPKLAHLSLSKISNVFELENVSGETLAAFLHKVYGVDITKGRKVRQFIGKYVAAKLKELRTDKSFRSVLASGGEFVVDMVEYFGAGESGDCWVR